MANSEIIGAGQDTARPAPKPNTCGDGAAIAQSLFQETDGGLTPTSPLHLVFKVVDSSCAALAYRKWHYLGDQGFIATLSFGAFFDGHLVGAISYGTPNATDLKGYWNRNTQARWWEIKRLVLKDECPRNSESRMIGVTIRLLQKMAYVKGIVTYADDSAGHCGTIYKASGFTALGMTAAKKDYVVNGVVKQRGKTKGMGGVWVNRSRKWLFIKQFKERPSWAQYSPAQDTMEICHTAPNSASTQNAQLAMDLGL
jgi:hypothetical protein